MNLSSHFYLGAKVFDTLDNDNLRKRMFQSGNVYPDIHPELGDASHYVENCPAMIRELAEKLLNDIEERYVSRSELSFRMGTVMHFVADYFTYVHDQERYKGNLIRHTLVEVGLDARMRYMSSLESDIEFCSSDDLDGLFNSLSLLKEEFDQVEFSNEINAKYIFAGCKGFMSSFVLIVEQQYEMARARQLAGNTI